MTDFIFGFGHALGNDLFTILGACPQAFFKLNHIGRKDKDFNQIICCGLCQLLRTLPVNVKDDVAAITQCLLDRRARRSVEVIKNFGMFQKLILIDHIGEFILGDEIVILAIFFAGAWLTCGCRNRHRHIRIFFKEHTRQCCLSSARWRRQHHHNATATGFHFFQSGWT